MVAFFVLILILGIQKIIKAKVIVFENLKKKKVEFCMRFPGSRCYIEEAEFFELILSHSSSDSPVIKPVLLII